MTPTNRFISLGRLAMMKNVRFDQLRGLVDVADRLAVQFIQPDKPFSKQEVFDHVRPLMPDSAGITPTMMDGIVWDVIDGIIENALRSIQDSAQ